MTTASRFPVFAWVGIACIAMLSSGCSEPSTPSSTAGGEPAADAAANAYEETLREQFESAKSGDVIEIPAGKHNIRRPLVLNVDGVTIRGAGMDQSTLSFAGQIAGAEGVLVNASDFTIEDLAIEDSIGDALKINEGSNISIRRVRTEWTNGPDPENGAYGIYPVLTENTLIDGVVAIGASDAGIYVGQSHNVVVKNSKAAYNVAGIEIENTTNADVFDNVAEHNTGGILVFNMPDIPKEGHSTRVFRNTMHNNNTANFGPPGSPVAGVPAGSGLMINSNDKVEIFENDFAGNDTAHIVISSYFSSGFSERIKRLEGFDPYPEQILIRNNAYQGGGGKPGLDHLDQIRVAVFGADGAFPAVIWDGFVPEDRAAQICVQDDVQLLNIDASNEGANITTDMANHACELGLLPAVSLGTLMGFSLRQALGAAALLCIASCTAPDPFAGKRPQFFSSDAYPEQLSGWQLLRRSGQTLRLNPAALDYDINMPLFSDYAAKYRSLWIPPGTQATQSEDGRFELPEGTIISKSFLYPEGHAGNRALTRLQGARLELAEAQLIETRLLVKQAQGWDAVAYLWQGEDAVLKRTGAIVPVRRSAQDSSAFNYIVPTRNECAGCHALNHSSGKLQPIGLQTAQLSHSKDAHGNTMLQRMQQRGWLDTVAEPTKPYAAWSDTSNKAANVSHQARDYLDSNCAHCHSPTGPAKNSGLNLARNNTDERSLGVCKPPIAAGKGSGNRLFSIVPGQPTQSILTYRLASIDPSKRMPEIGRSLAHSEGLQLVEQWLQALSGDCL